MGSTLLSTTPPQGLPEVPGYRTLRRLGEGGMGQVYLAIRAGTNFEVAIKILHPELAARPALAEQFEKLALALRAVEHENVVRVIDFGRLAAGAPFMVMERLVGQDLGQIISESAPLEPDHVIALARQAAAGLAVSHQAGLVHLDITPNNLFVSTGEKETLRLIDFGIAQIHGVRPVSPGPPMGTAEYWSPEQASGGAVDGRSDLYSLGVVLYEALSGALPFHSHTLSGVVEQHVHGAPLRTVRRDDGVALPEELTSIVTRCLARDPAQRYASADELLAALTALPPSPSVARPPLRTGAYRAPAGHASTMSAPVVPTGKSEELGPLTVLGSYRLLQLVGEGGMGMVYLAEHVRLGRRVALKLLRSELSGDAHSVSRFFAEARAVNRICHENIVEITDFIENPGGDNYYIMEFLPGLNLDQLVTREGSISLARALGIVVQVCSALGSVHEAEIVHRDLKPENIFLIERGGQKDFVKLLDFGIAKLGAKDDSISLHKTGAGTIIGTPEYMSPEQASGMSVDPRSDIYALGIILYELVTGENPFSGANFGEMLVRRLSETAVPPSRCKLLTDRVPPELDELILQCLQREVAARPQTVREVEDRLRAIAAAHACVLESFVEGEPLVPPRERPPLWMTGGGAAAALLLAIGGYLALRHPSAAPAPAPVGVAPAPVAAPMPQPVETPEVETAVAVEQAPAPRPGKRVRDAQRRSKLDGPSRHAVMDPFK